MPGPMRPRGVPFQCVRAFRTVRCGNVSVYALVIVVFHAGKCTLCSAVRPT